MITMVITITMITMETVITMITMEVMVLLERNLKRPTDMDLVVNVVVVAVDVMVVAVDVMVVAVDAMDNQVNRSWCCWRET